MKTGRERLKIRGVRKSSSQIALHSTIAIKGRVRVPFEIFSTGVHPPWTHCRSFSKEGAEALVPSACATTLVQMLRSPSAPIDKHLCLAEHQIQVAGSRK